MYQDPPLERFPSFQLLFPKGNPKKLVLCLLVVGVIFLSVVSVGLNAYLYVSFAPELREKRFIDSNRDRIALLLFSGGGSEKAVVLDDSNGEIVVQFSGGTATFKKGEIRKIIYNVYGRSDHKEKPSEGATP